MNSLNGCIDGAAALNDNIESRHLGFGYAVIRRCCEIESVIQHKSAATVSIFPVTPAIPRPCIGFDFLLVISSCESLRISVFVDIRP